MHLYREGERSEGMCATCEARVQTRFAVRTVPLDGGIQVPNVLAAVCERCGGIVALPAQSAPRLREALQRRKEESLEARIPSHLEDVIHLLAGRFSAPVQAFRPAVLRFYLGEVVHDAAFAQRVHALAESDLGRAPARARLSLRAPQALLHGAREQARQAGIERDSDLLRGLLLAAKEDVLDGRHPERILRLGGAAQAEGAPRPRPEEA